MLDFLPLRAVGVRKLDTPGDFGDAQGQEVGDAVKVSVLGAGTFGKYTRVRGVVGPGKPRYEDISNFPRRGKVA